MFNKKKLKKFLEKQNIAVRIDEDKFYLNKYDAEGFVMLPCINLKLKDVVMCEVVLELPLIENTFLLNQWISANNINYTFVKFIATSDENTFITFRIDYLRKTITKEDVFGLIIKLLDIGNNTVREFKEIGLIKASY